MELEYRAVHPEHGYPVCGCRSRKPNRFGEYVCLTRPMKGGICCRKHGGKTPKGADSPHAKHLRYSQVPVRLLEGYEAALGDERLLELRDESALLQARVNDLLGRVDSGESGQLWAEVGKTWEKYNKALRHADADQEAAHRQYLDQLIRSGVDDYRAWDEVVKVVDQKRRISESERKRLHEMEVMIAANQIGTLILAVGEMFRANVTKHVRNADERRSLLTDTQTDIGRLVSGGSG